MQPHFRLNAAQIKLIAIAAMLIDHIAWGFTELSSPLSQIMHMIGRITAPTMCFFLAEGYYHTRDLRKYFARLGVFALISHFAFTYFEHGKVFVASAKSSVISTLLIALLCVHIYHGGQRTAEDNPPALLREPALRLPLIALMTYFASKCDWGVNAVLFTMCFVIARKYGLRMQLRAYAIAAVYYILTRWNPLSMHSGFSWSMLYVIGVLLPVPLLMCYNGERGGGTFAKPMKWFFYVFYPAHLILLGLLRYS